MKEPEKTEPASTFRKRERHETKFGEQERFTLGITETRLRCHLMQIESHTMKDCI